MSFVVFLYGLVFGSFFHVVGCRVPVKRSFILSRSTCSHCHHPLTAMELIPVLSYIKQKGRCINCQARISPIYILVELITAILFTYAYIDFGIGLEWLLAITFISLLIIITVSDLLYMVIPDKLLLFFSGFFLIERYLLPLEPWWDSFLGAAVGFFLPFSLAIITKGGMGGGDIKLFAVIGLVLGTKGIWLTFILSAFLGVIGGLIGLWLGLISRKQPFPFGPFIAASALLVLFRENSLLKWYEALVT
ncbi:A24 family peptidase [Bacillus sp. REN10]|uniref:prepilin peptidase n=1 Tax=Bacillus sp. REN10 TaxID=2782541 RepID=UPI00193C5F5A|nr:A24 family peptidase [Bacillus sp. REN10]